MVSDVSDEQFEREFIRIFQAEECLWKNDNSNSNEEKIERATKRLLTKYREKFRKADIHTVKLKLQAVKNNFFKEFTKLKKNSNYKSPMPFFQELMFLEDEEINLKKLADDIKHTSKDAVTSNLEEKLSENFITPKNPTASTSSANRTIIKSNKPIMNTKTVNLDYEKVRKVKNKETPSKASAKSKITSNDGSSALKLLNRSFNQYNNNYRPMNKNYENSGTYKKVSSTNSEKNLKMDISIPSADTPKHLNNKAMELKSTQDNPFPTSYQNHNYQIMSEKQRLTSDVPTRTPIKLFDFLNEIQVFSEDKNVPSLKEKKQIKKNRKLSSHKIGGNLESTSLSVADNSPEKDSELNMDVQLTKVNEPSNISFIPSLPSTKKETRISDLKATSSATEATNEQSDLYIGGNSNRTMKKNSETKNLSQKKRKRSGDVSKNVSHEFSEKDFEIMGLNIGNKIRKLPQNLVHIVEHLINRVLLEAEKGQVNEYSYITILNKMNNAKEPTTS